MKRVLALLVVATLAASGCFTANAQLPGTLRNDLESNDVESAGRVEIEKTNWFFLFGLVGAPQPNFLSDELKQQVKAKGGDGVRNLTYEAQFGCVDLIVGFLTFQCVSPRTYKVTGEVVKIKAARIPGKNVIGMNLKEGGERVAQAY